MILPIISIVLALAKGLIPMLTASNAPAEIIADAQSAVDLFTKVHGTIVTKAQVDSLLIDPKW